jgi:hypothetical protein
MRPNRTPDFDTHTSMHIVEGALSFVGLVWFLWKK